MVFERNGDLVDMRNRRVSVAFCSLICVLFFTVLLTPCLLESDLFANLRIQVSYHTKENNAIDRVLVSRIMHSGAVMDQTQSEQFLYDDEKERWEIQGDECGTIEFYIKSWQFLTFTVEYRLTSQDALLSDEMFHVNVFQNGQLIQSNDYLFGQVYDVRQKFVYWQAGIEAIGLITGVWIAFFSACMAAGYWIRKTMPNFAERMKHFDPQYVLLSIFAITCFTFLTYAAPVNPFLGDTGSYFVDSVSDFSWYYRMPVYEFLLWVIKSITNVGEWEAVFPIVINVQRIFTVIGIWAFYDTLKKICKNQFISTVFSYMYVMAVSIWGYIDFVMTESIAVSFMCMLIWLIVKVIETGRKKYIISCCALSVIAILERPSFLFLLPALGVFFLVYGLYKKNKMVLRFGLGGVAVCTLLILAYCKRNESLSGQFMLCSVSYHNQGANLLKGNMYVNAEYPDITAAAVQKAQHPKYSLPDSGDLCREFGYDTIARYQKSCRKLYLKQYVYYLLDTNVLDWLDKPIIEERMIADTYLNKILETVRLLVIPYDFALLIIVSVMEFAYGAWVFVRHRKLNFLSFGIPGCIWSVLITSMISLEDDALPRLVICVIPLALMLTAMVLDQLGCNYWPVDGKYEKEKGSSAA